MCGDRAVPIHGAALEVEEDCQPRSSVRASILGGVATITLRLASGRLLLGSAAGLRVRLGHCLQLAAARRLHAVCFRIVGQGGDLPQSASEMQLEGAMEHLELPAACGKDVPGEDLSHEIGGLRILFMQLADAGISVVTEIRGRLRDTAVLILACSDVVLADHRATLTVVYGHPGASILAEAMISKGLETGWEMLAGGYRLSAIVAQKVRLVSNIIDTDGQTCASLGQWVRSKALHQPWAPQRGGLQCPDTQPNHLVGVPGKCQSKHAVPGGFYASDPPLPEILLKAPPASATPLIGGCSTTSGSSCSSNHDGDSSLADRASDLMIDGLGQVPQGFLHHEHVWGAAAPTTLIIRNLPIWMTLGKLADIIDAMGFKATYDVLHLPQGGIPSVPRDTILGYGFINFPNPLDAEKFAKDFVGYRFEGAARKACIVSPSVLQGKEASLSRINRHADVHPSRLPLVRDLCP